MTHSLDQVFDYVQERCLWQFHSRSWDRATNIDGILAMTGEILAGREPEAATPNDRCFLADAKVMVSDLRSRFPWIGEIGETETRALLDGLRERLVDITITKSRNHELNHTLY